MSEPAFILHHNAPREPQPERLLRFFSSDPEFDASMNEYLWRHLSVDERGVYWGHGPVVGATDHLWCIEWDYWFLPWVDRAAMGLQRQPNPIDVIKDTLARAPIDRFGFVFGGTLTPENPMQPGSYKPQFGWPWPKYWHNNTAQRPSGWEFNDPGDSVWTEITLRDLKRLDGEAGWLTLEVTGDHPELTLPAFDTDALHVPVIELDIAYDSPDASEAVNTMSLWWTRADAPHFDASRRVDCAFSVLPPARFPDDYMQLVSNQSGRYPLYFRMHLHPEWGREGRRITGLRLAPCGAGHQGLKLRLNYIRATYDTGLLTTNGILITNTSRFYNWSGDVAFLRRMIPRARAAMLFLLEHLRGRRDGLVNTGWMVGKQGLGPEPGRSVYGSYWDLLPVGVYDIESSVFLYAALRAMANLERAARRQAITAGPVQVDGPDGRAVTYRETPATLERLAARVKRRIETVLWSPETGRFVKTVDVRGQKHDYGYLHFTLWAMAHGIGTTRQRRAVFNWVTGRRTVTGDTSTGRDIYRFRFGPRTSTKRNESWYYWVWYLEGKKEPPDSPWYYSRQWEQQMQDGGAIPATSLFDLMLRCGEMGREGANSAWWRALEIISWFRDVKAAGGDGHQFYRAYYDNHPERGRQQSPMPGGIGLDREFLSDSSCLTMFPLLAFLGVSADEDGVLMVAPRLPDMLDRLGAENVYYRGNWLRIDATRDGVSFAGSRAPSPGDARVRLRLSPSASGGAPTVNGKTFQPVRRLPDGRYEYLIALRMLV